MNKPDSLTNYNGYWETIENGVVLKVEDRKAIIFKHPNLDFVGLYVFINDLGKSLASSKFNLISKIRDFKAEGKGLL